MNDNRKSMQPDPKPGDLAQVVRGPGPAFDDLVGLVVRVDGVSGWYYLTFEDSDWETYFRRDQIRVISKG